MSSKQESKVPPEPPPIPGLGLPEVTADQFPLLAKLWRLLRRK